MSGSCYWLRRLVKYEIGLDKKRFGLACRADSLWRLRKLYRWQRALFGGNHLQNVGTSRSRTANCRHICTLRCCRVCRRGVLSREPRDSLCQVRMVQRACLCTLSMRSDCHLVSPGCRAWVAYSTTGLTECTRPRHSVLEIHSAAPQNCQEILAGVCPPYHAVHM